MKYLYTYSTPDGKRHEGETSARSKDRAYAVLKEQGIRPIKVWLKPFTKAQFVTLGAVVVVIVAVVAVSFAYGNDVRDIVQYGIGPRRELVALKRAATDIRIEYNAAFDSIESNVFSDFSSVEESKDVSSFVKTVESGREVIEVARRKARGLFRDVYERFPASGENARLEAQRMYGELMNVLDADEERIVRDLRALKLLADSPDDWRVNDGKLVFTNVEIERKYRSYRRDFDVATSRWERDFGR